MHKFKQVRDLVALGVSDVEIAAKLKMHRETVAKYRKSNTPPRYTQRKESTRKDPLQTVRELFEELNGQNLSAQEVFEDLKEAGFEGSYRTVARRSGEIKAAVPKERFFEQTYEPGEQSQFDFKECVKIPFVSGVRVCHLHFGTLPFSSHFWITAYSLRTYECFSTGIDKYFRELGGITKSIRIDNLKPCVDQVFRGKSRKYTSSFERFVDYYGFEVSPCSPGKGNEKGHVERDIQTHARRIENLIRKEGLVFENMDDFNTWLAGYCRKKNEANEKITAEKACLRPIPEFNESVLGKVFETTPTKLGTVRHNHSVYSVPDTFIGVTCKVIISAEQVVVEPVNHDVKKKLGKVVHERVPYGQSSVLLEHCIWSLVRKPEAMLRWQHKEVLFPNETFRNFYNFIKNCKAFSPEKEFLSSVNLLHNVPISELEVGMKLTMEAKVKNPFDSLKELLFLRRTPESLNAQPKLTYSLEHFDKFIHKGANLEPRPTF